MVSSVLNPYKDKEKEAKQGEEEEDKLEEEEDKVEEDEENEDHMKIPDEHDDDQIEVPNEIDSLEEKHDEEELLQNNMWKTLSQVKEFSS